jgi:hypothetical protein
MEWDGRSQPSIEWKYGLPRVPQLSIEWRHGLTAFQGMEPKVSAFPGGEMGAYCFPVIGERGQRWAFC